MLGWVAAASGLGACLVAVAWCYKGPDAIGRPAPKPWVSGCLLVILSLLTGTLAIRQHFRENKLSSVASSLAGLSVRVRCQSIAGAFTDANVESGYVHWRADGRPEAAAILKPDVCRSLAAYMRSPGRRPPEAQVVAVHVLTHEAMHMAGLKDEAEAECAAVKRDATTARLLGANAADARALALRYWTVVYPRLPDEYRSAACSPDGPLDEALADGPLRGGAGQEVAR